MGMLSRILRMWKADLHGVMDQFEDKGLLLKQYLREMEESLQQKEARRDQVLLSCRQIQHDIEGRGQEVATLGQEIDLALGKSKDDMARMLIHKRRGMAAAITHLQQQLDTLTEEQEHLDQLAMHQRLQYDQLKLKADAFFRWEQGCQPAPLPVGPYPEVAVSNNLGSFSSSGDNEVELELLQRKEALAQGGAP